MSSPLCAWCGQPKKPGNVTYCSKSCTATASRAKQSREQRSRIARLARAAQLRRWWPQLLQRIRKAGVTEEQRIYLAYQLGCQTRKARDWRKRKAAA